MLHCRHRDGRALRRVAVGGRGTDDRGHIADERYNLPPDVHETRIVCMYVSIRGTLNFDRRQMFLYLL